MNSEHSHNDVDIHAYLAAHALHLLRCSSLGASGIFTHRLELTGQSKREMRVDTTCTRTRRRCGAAKHHNLHVKRAALAHRRV